MGEITISGGGSLIGILNTPPNGLVIPKPFEQEIFLFDTFIAGTSHIEGMKELSEHLAEGEILDFFREIDNEYDEMAIVIKTTSGVKIGYIPKADNVIFARLMDAGKFLYGRIAEKSLKGEWVKIKIKIFLKE